MWMVVIWLEGRECISKDNRLIIRNKYNLTLLRIRAHIPYLCEYASHECILSVKSFSFVVNYVDISVKATWHISRLIIPSKPAIRWTCS